MPVCAQVISREAFTGAATLVFEDEKYLSVVRRSGIKIIHSLVPNRQLCTRYVVTGCPAMGFALHQDLLFGATQIKSMRFLGGSDANIDVVTYLKVHALQCKESLSDQLELAANMSVGD